MSDSMSLIRKEAFYVNVKLLDKKTILDVTTTFNAKYYNVYPEHCNSNIQTPDELIDALQKSERTTKPLTQVYFDFFKERYVRHLPNPIAQTLINYCSETISRLPKSSIADIKLNILSEYYELSGMMNEIDSGQDLVIFLKDHHPVVDKIMYCMIGRHVCIGIENENQEQELIKKLTEAASYFDMIYKYKVCFNYDIGNIKERIMNFVGQSICHLKNMKFHEFGADSPQPKPAPIKKIPFNDFNNNVYDFQTAYEILANLPGRVRHNVGPFIFKLTNDEIERIIISYNSVCDTRGLRTLSLALEDPYDVYQFLESLDSQILKLFLEICEKESIFTLNDVIRYVNNRKREI